MASAYFSVGAAQGIKRGLDEARTRGIEDEDRAAAKEDRAELKQERVDRRARRSTLEGREDDQYRYTIEQRPLETRERAARVDAAELGAKTGKVALETAETQLGYAKEDRPRQVERQKLADETAEYALKSTKKKDAQEDEVFNQKQKESQRQAQEEGFDEFLDALEDGADPNYAVSRYNSRGKFGIRPGTVKYDPKTGALSLVHSDGKNVENFNGTLAQLRAALPRKTRAPVTTKLGVDDRLITTGPGGKLTDVTPPPAAGTGRRGGPGDRFNRQTFIKQAQDSLSELMGARYDNVREQFQFDDKLQEKGRIGQAFVGQIARLLEQSDPPIQAEPGEIAALALASVRGIRGVTEVSEEVQADPLFKGATPDKINSEVARRVEQSKVSAATALRKEVENFAATRSVIQQGQQARENSLPAAKPSADIDDPSVAAGTPSIEEFQGVGPNQGIRRPDGSIWVLGEDGQPKRYK